MPSAFTVVYDACVLYPAPLRDLLMRVAMTGLYRAKWSAEIHAEWMRNVLKNRPDLTAAQLERTRHLMDRSVMDSLVTGHEQLVPGLSLPDEDDRHVLAAAIVSGASAIITYNGRDFPASSLEPFGIEALHPDEFLASQLDLNPPVFCRAVRELRESLRAPAMSVDDLLRCFLNQRLAETVSQLGTYRDWL